ncbi:hypothetical protein Chor_010572 [Crotalus horridus]
MCVLPAVFVMEYYKDTVWKGLLGFVISVVASIFYFKTSATHQDFSAFFIFSMVSGLWLVISNVCKRRLIINHSRDVYQFYIRGILWHEGPLHQIYVRTVSQRDAYGKLFYSLIINGYRLEVLTLVRLTKNYEVRAGKKRAGLGGCSMGSKGVKAGGWKSRSSPILPASGKLASPLS